MLTTEEFTKATLDQLQKEIKKAEMEHAQIALIVRTGQSKANHEIRLWRKYKARLLTHINSLKRKESQKGLEKEKK